MNLIAGKLINPEVRIENTNLCNANCSICPREKMTRPKVVLGMRHFSNLVDQAKILGAETISIFGYGEPLIDKGIVEKVKYCTDNNLKTFITTNASLLTESVAERLIDAGLGHIRFSVHGFSDTYSMIHRGLVFEQVKHNIAHFVLQNKSTKTAISVIPMNGEPISRIRSYWEHIVDELEIWRPHNWVDGRSYRGIPIMRRKSTCGRPFRGPIQIQADGKMIVCCFDFDGKMVIGDTYRDSIKDILQTSKELKKIRQSHETKNYHGWLCGNCDQLNIEIESPLLWSNVDNNWALGKTSSTKFNLQE